MLRWVPFVVFLHYFLKFKSFDDFSLPKCECKSLCLWLECVWVHPLNKDVSQAIIGTFWLFISDIFKSCQDGSLLCFLFSLGWSLNRLKCDGQCLFLSYCESCFEYERSFLTGKEFPGECVHCRSPPQTKYKYIYSSRWTTQYEYIWSLIQVCFVDQQSWSIHQLIPIHTELSFSLHRNIIARHS